ncbi:MAG TPA: hypothetical protein GX008_10840 [Firmicutes bacterium]|jgi:hypothetical protein|nr:hypothetical protein [Bacillota bacterium]
MLKIRDRVLLGTVSGLLASLPMLYLVGREAEWGLVNPGQGLLAGRSTAPTVGIATTYLLSLTGTEGALFKGAALSTVAGLFSPAPRPRIPNPAGAQVVGPIMGLVNRALFGGLCAALAIYLGDDRLFPQHKWAQGPTYSHEDYPYAQTITIKSPPTYGGVPERR